MLLEKENIVEIIKNVVEKAVARGKFYKGSYIDIPVLALLMFTSYKYVPQDYALLRKLIVITFTYGERIAPEKVEEFKKKVIPRLSKLQAICSFVASHVMRGN